MPSPRPNNDVLTLFDSPWLKRQVNGHLVFGLFADNQKIFWLVVLFFLYVLANIIIFVRKSANLVDVIFSYFHIAVAFFLFYLTKFSGYYQAAIWWCATKFGLLIISFIFILMGFVEVFKGSESGVYSMMLGLVWIPSIEFLPKVTPHQKIITILRLLITVAIIPFIK